MDVSLVTDGDGRMICTLRPDNRALRQAQGAPSLSRGAVLVTAADATLASMELLEALEAVGQNGYGECVWREAGGDYRWMFRRHGTKLTVVALWSSGTLTGWQHVLHIDTDFDTFVTQVRAGLCES